jgi:hypothetical protein
MKLHMFAGTEAIVMAAKVRYWKIKLCNVNSLQLFV